MRYARCVSECLLHAFYTTRKHLFRYIDYLCVVSRILEKNHVLRVYANGPTLFPFWKYILHQIYKRRVTMVTLLREQFCHPLVRFQHEVVDDHQVSIVRIERRQIGKILDAFQVRMYGRDENTM